MRRSIFLTFLLIHLGFNIYSQGTFTVSGFLRESNSGENIIGGIVYAPKSDIAAETNSYGFYALTIPAGDSVRLVFSSDSYLEKDTVFSLQQNVLLNISLTSEADTKLSEVVITEHQAKISKDVEMSKIEIPVSTIKNIPALLGEKDVLKVIQLLPGVKRGKEGTMGYYVRGGGPDQNLILLDDAVVYNAQHLFGFFSVFNGDAIRNIELTKGGFPARYGGRLSSVLDIRMKDGHKEKLHGEAGIGILSSRLTLEGPIKKGKSSFLVSGRRTYFDILTKPFQPAATKFGYYFYDFNAKVNFVLSPKDKIFISSYLGRDIFYIKLKDEDQSFKSSLAWGNTTATARWNHIFSSNLFCNTSLIFSNYKFVTGITAEDGSETTSFKYTSRITDLGLKLDFDYIPSPQHKIRFGTNSVFHLFQPTGIKLTNSSQSDENINKQYEIKAFDGAVFVEDVYSPSMRWKINPGVRLTTFTPNGVTYKNIEPRLGVAYLMKKDWTLKGSYASMNQYIHLLTNAGLGLPTDLWVPSTKTIKPQKSQQVALGVAKDVSKHNVQLSVEAYYKEMQNTVSYKEGKGFVDAGVSLLSQDQQWENVVTQGKGKSYGVEFLAQRKMGRFNGWVGYTLSWAKQKYAEVNNGEEFFARYDSRHDISVVGVYEVSKKITVSGTWVYNTGYPINPPISTYGAISSTQILNSQAGAYSSSRDKNEYPPRNSLRMQDYHRFDIGIQFSKIKPSFTRIFELSVYNLYSRQNPFMYYIDADYSSTGYETKLKKVSIFPIIPSVSWTFKF